MDRTRVEAGEGLIHVAAPLHAKPTPPSSSLPHLNRRSSAVSPLTSPCSSSPPPPPQLSDSRKGRMPSQIQPLNAKSAARAIPARPAGMLRLKRMFDRQFNRASSSEKLIGDGDAGDGDGEPSTVTLDCMVRSHMEGGGNNNEKPPSWGSCCFSAFGDSSDEDDEGDVQKPISAAEILKGLVQNASQAERKVLADVLRIAAEGSIPGSRKREDSLFMVKALRELNYDASICRSSWETKARFPGGKYEYIDVVVGDERVLIDVDFRSEFDIVRPTKTYTRILESVPAIFVGNAKLLGQVVAVLADASRQSMRKTGLHFPPWRRAEYLKSKWLSSDYYRTEVGEKGETNGRNGYANGNYPPEERMPLRSVKPVSASVVTSSAAAINESA